MFILVTIIIDVKKISQIILTIHEEVTMHVHLSMVFFLIASTQYTIDEYIMFDTSDIQDTLFLEMVATFKFTKKN